MKYFYFFHVILFEKIRKRCFNRSFEDYYLHIVYLSLSSKEKKPMTFHNLFFSFFRCEKGWFERKKRNNLLWTGIYEKKRKQKDYRKCIFRQLPEKIILRICVRDALQSVCIIIRFFPWISPKSSLRVSAINK